MNYFLIKLYIYLILSFLDVKPFSIIIHKSNQFDNNTKPDIFLGYAFDSLGYKILDTSTNSTVTSRDVYYFLL